jgi:hypothetical protein
MDAEPGRRLITGRKIPAADHRRGPHDHGEEQHEHPPHLVILRARYIEAFLGHLIRWFATAIA